MVEIGCESDCVSVFQTRKAHVEQVSFLLLTQQELCHRPLDLGRPVSRQNLGMHVFFDSYESFRLRHSSALRHMNCFAHTDFLLSWSVFHGFSAPVISYSSVFCLPSRLYSRVFRESISSYASVFFCAPVISYSRLFCAPVISYL